MPTFMLVKLGRGIIVFACILFFSAPTLGHSENIPLSVRRAVVQAQQALANKHYDAALAALEQQRQRQPHHYLIDFTLGNIYLLSARHQQAIPYYRAVLQAHPEHAASWLNMAQCYYATAQYIPAAQAFVAGYRYRTPPQGQLLYNGALAYLQGEQPDQALPVLKQLLADFPNEISTSWRGALVQVYLQLQQPQQAIVQLEILVHQTSGDEQRRWRELLVQQYLALNLAKQALAAVQTYLEDDGLEVRWWQLLTHLQLEAGRQEPALVALKVLAYLHPLTEAEIRLLADLHFSLGVPGQAIHYYQQLQQQHPYDNNLLTRLAYASLNLHQPEQALFWAQQGGGIQDDAADERAVGLLQLPAQLLFSLKRYSEAVALFGQLAQVLTAGGKDAGAAWLMQGYAAWNGELWSQARSALQQAQRYPDQRQRATQLLRQLGAN